MFCVACSCHLEGAISRSCDQMTGQCRCKEGVVGWQCDRCPVNIHLFTFNTRIMHTFIYVHDRAAVIVA